MTAWHYDVGSVSNISIFTTKHFGFVSMFRIIATGWRFGEKNIRNTRRSDVNNKDLALDSPTDIACR